MNFKVDDLKAGPKATMQTLNPWAAAIRWILDWIDAQPANAPQSFTIVEMDVWVNAEPYTANIATVGELTPET